jgi:hypothetical protein
MTYSVEAFSEFQSIENPDIWVADLTLLLKKFVG